MYLYYLCTYMTIFIQKSRKGAFVWYVFYSVFQEFRLLYHSSKITMVNLNKIQETQDLIFCVYDNTKKFGCQLAHCKCMVLGENRMFVFGDRR